MSSCPRCNSSHVELRRRVIASGAIQYVNQCQECGKTGQAKAHATAMQITGGKQPADYNPTLERDYYDRKHQEAVAEREKGKAKFFAWYQTYLQSDEWAAKRALVITRAGGVCEGCGIAEATQVHHMTYDHVGEEFLWELVAICKPCHERYHAGDIEEDAA